MEADDYKLSLVDRIGEYIGNLFVGMTTIEFVVTVISASTITSLILTIIFILTVK